MAINVTLGGVNTQKEKQFPKLMAVKSGHPSEGTVVFFVSSRKGFLIKGFGNYENANAGLYLSNWNDDAFTDFNEPITIQNQ